MLKNAGQPMANLRRIFQVSTTFESASFLQKQRIILARTLFRRATLDTVSSTPYYSPPGQRKIAAAFLQNFAQWTKIAETPKTILLITRQGFESLALTSKSFWNAKMSRRSLKNVRFPRFCGISSCNWIIKRYRTCGCEDREQSKSWKEHKLSVGSLESRDFG